VPISRVPLARGGHAAIVNDSYEDLAIAWLQLQAEQLAGIMRVNGVSDASVRHVVCESFISGLGYSLGDEPSVELGERGFEPLRSYQARLTFADDEGGVVEVDGSVSLHEAAGIAVARALGL
jgi:hypothetical protein